MHSDSHARTKGRRPDRLPSAVKSPILVRERRAELVRAAIQVFSAKGFHTSKVSDIARAAGMSQGTVYNYVGSKEDILYLVCAEVFSAFDETVKQAIEGTTGPRNRIERLLSASVDATFKYQDHLLLLYQELHCLDRKARQPFLRDAAKLREIFSRILEDASTSERIVVGNRLITANILLNLPSLIVMRRWDLHGKVSGAELRDALIEFMRRGLGLS